MKSKNMIDDSRERFRSLSSSRKKWLVREARKFIRENPGSADNNRFWRRLSARHVIAEGMGKDA